MVLKTTEKVKDKSEINPAGLNKNECDSIFCKRDHNIILNTSTGKETQDIDNVVGVVERSTTSSANSIISFNDFILPDLSEELQHLAYRNDSHDAAFDP